MSSETDIITCLIIEAVIGSVLNSAAARAAGAAFHPVSRFCAPKSGACLSKCDINASIRLRLSPTSGS